MVKLKLLGAPGLSDDNDTIIPLKNRKELALLAFLARLDTASARRDVLAKTLWSRGTDAESRMSLRQAVKNLRNLEDQCGECFLVTNRASVGFVGTGPHTDVQIVLEALSQPRACTLKTARSLLPTQWKATDQTERRSAFLCGYENLDPVFESWRQSEANAIRNRFAEIANETIERVSDPRDATLPELARFLLALDPADEWAHYLLILHFLVTGDRVRATRQFEDCVQELADRLGTVPSPASAKLLKLPKSQWNGQLPPKSVFYSKLDYNGQTSSASNSPLNLSGIDNTAAAFSPLNYDLPVIQYFSPRAIQQYATPMSEEFIEQIGRNRDFALLRNLTDDWTDKNPPQTAGVSKVHFGINDYKGGSFLLQTKEETGTGAIMIELRSRENGKPVFTDIISAGPTIGVDDRKYLIGRSVSMLERKIADFYKRDRILSDSIYRKLADVYELTAEFDARSSKTALEILDAIETRTGPTGQTYAYRSSIYLQQNLRIQPNADRKTLLNQASDMAMKAIHLDRWHPINHRYQAFVACYLGRQSEGQEHMLVAQSLKPYDPHQNIATAETCAFADNIDQAFVFRDAALGLIRQVPRYYFGYLANIAFAAGDFDAAATHAQQAPLESMDYQATRIAALWQQRRFREARDEMQSCMARQQNRHADQAEFRPEDVVEWMCAINPFANAKTLACFQQGLRSAFAEL